MNIYQIIIKADNEERYKIAQILHKIGYQTIQETDKEIKLIKVK